MSDEERARNGLRRLPETLEDALAALAGDTVVTSWFAPELLASFVAVKRSEIGLMAGLDRHAVCAAFGARY